MWMDAISNNYKQSLIRPQSFYTHQPLLKGMMLHHLQQFTEDNICIMSFITHVF